MIRLAVPRTIALHWPAALAAAFVLLAYAYFASAGRLRDLNADGQSTYYSLQARGFLKGQLSLDLEPDPGLIALKDPYSIKDRGDINYAWDASYYQGRYYLYFSALPALLLHVPMHVLFGHDPMDAEASAIFLSLSFLIWVAVLYLVLGNGAKTIPMWLWILTIGLGNGLPASIAAPSVYEIPITCGTLWTAAWAYAGVSFHRHAGWRWAAALGLCLGLAVATRPNLAVLGLPTLILLVRGGRPEFWRHSVAAAVPFAAIASAIAGYNYARFGSISEFGLTYQLTFIPMQGRKMCSLCTVSDVTRMVGNLHHYLFWSPRVSNVFPYFQLLPHQMDTATSFPMSPEQVGGLLPLSPVVGFAVVSAVVTAMRPLPRWNLRESFGFFFFLAAMLVLASLSTCWWVVERYTMDFTGLAMCAGVLCCESGSERLVQAGAVQRRIRIVLAAVLGYALVSGVLLGFRGAGDRFQRANPELIETLRNLHYIGPGS